MKTHRSASQGQICVVSFRVGRDIALKHATIVCLNTVKRFLQIHITQSSLGWLYHFIKKKRQMQNWFIKKYFPLRKPKPLVRLGSTLSGLIVHTKQKCANKIGMFLSNCDQELLILYTGTRRQKVWKSYLCSNSGPAGVTLMRNVFLSFLGVFQ